MKWNISQVLSWAVIIGILYIGINYGWLWGMLIMLILTIVWAFFNSDTILYWYNYGAQKAQKDRMNFIHLWRVFKGKDEPYIYNELQRKKAEEKEKLKKQMEEYNVKTDMSGMQEDKEKQ